MTATADDVIDALGLVPHPEGGFYREMYRSRDLIPAVGLPARFGGPRPASTAIYFLLRGSQHSALHRLRADELWHHYAGSSLTLHQIHPDGRLTEVRLGRLDAGGVPQATVPAGCWFGATVDDPHSFALAGCTVSPGFTMKDFELGNPASLVAEFPQHERLIRRLAPSSHAD
jgi:predicted cupin superfamily sugar epimerase